MLRNDDGELSVVTNESTSAAADGDELACIGRLSWRWQIGLRYELSVRVDHVIFPATIP